MEYNRFPFKRSYLYRFVIFDTIVVGDGTVLYDHQKDIMNEFRKRFGAKTITLEVTESKDPLSKPSIWEDTLLMIVLN